MAMTSFPPQAYTRDVLSAAYEWLRTQPASIRELAQDADSLVALYMKSRRNPASLNGMNRPANSEVSSRPTAPENIRSNVTEAVRASLIEKSPRPHHNALEQAILPGGLDEMRGTVEVRSGSANAFQEDLKNLAEGLKQFEGPAASLNLANAAEMQAAAKASPSPLPSPSQAAPQRPVMRQPQRAAPILQQPTAPAAPQAQQFVAFDLGTLDSQSLIAIQTVQTKLNLGHPNEALRMLISLGFDRALGILPKN